MPINFWWEHLKERDHLEDLGTNSVKMDLREIGWKGADWSHLAMVTP
jgi:hypothetical protein